MSATTTVSLSMWPSPHSRAAGGAGSTRRGRASPARSGRNAATCRQSSLPMEPPAPVTSTRLPVTAVSAPRADDVHLRRGRSAARSAGRACRCRRSHAAAPRGTAAGADGAPWLAARRPSSRTWVTVIDGMAIDHHLGAGALRAPPRGRRACPAPGCRGSGGRCLAGSSSRNPTGVSPNERTRCRSRGQRRARPCRRRPRSVAQSRSSADERTDWTSSSSGSFRVRADDVVDATPGRPGRR